MTTRKGELVSLPRRSAPKQFDRYLIVARAHRYRHCYRQRYADLIINDEARHL